MDRLNRSEEIRRFFKENPNARPRDCINTLAARGIDVTPTLVSCVRAKLRDQASERGIDEDVSVVRSFVESSGLDPDVAVEILVRFADVVEKVGGIERFRRVLGVISQGPGGGVEEEEEEDEVPVAPAPVASVPVAPAPAPAPASTSESLYEDVNDDDEDY